MLGVTGAAVMAAAGLGKPPSAAAQTNEPAKPYRIDVHHHLSRRPTLPHRMRTISANSR
jgi:hypothetical protein